MDYGKSKRGVWDTILMMLNNIGRERNTDLGKSNGYVINQKIVENGPAPFRAREEAPSHQVREKASSLATRG